MTEEHHNHDRLVRIHQMLDPTGRSERSIEDLIRELHGRKGGADHYASAYRGACLLMIVATLCVLVLHWAGVL